MDAFSSDRYLRDYIWLHHLPEQFPMMISLSVDEAVAIYIAGQAVKLEYELEGSNLAAESYLALASAVRKMDLQLWQDNQPAKKAAE